MPLTIYKMEYGRLFLLRKVSFSIVIHSIYWSHVFCQVKHDYIRYFSVPSTGGWIQRFTMYSCYSLGIVWVNAGHRQGALAFLHS